MLEIIVPGDEGWDSEKEEFVYIKPPVTLKLEHSLLSLAKWETKWHKPFLKNLEGRTITELMDYVRCMTITQNISSDVYERLSKENFEAINKYINDPATATVFYEKKNTSRQNGKPPKWMADRKVQTAETIYAAMFECGIPIEFEKRHLNHLLTLIRVCQERANPSGKMSKRDLLSWQRAQNEARRKKLGTRG